MSELGLTTPRLRRTPPTEGNVPQLRFPEFKDAGAWEEKRLGNVSGFFKGKGISKSDIDIQGNVPCIRYGELYTTYNEVIKVVVSKTNSSILGLFLSKKNDILIPSSGETKLDIAKASCLLVDDVALGGDLNILRTSEDGVFLSYMLNGVCKTEIAKKAQGDTVVHLYSSQLKLLDVLLPSLPEQQKIAACLSSLDDLISTENQQLEALKNHKKGLMQHLFPAEGETLPKLRFLEFMDAVAWENKSLGDIGSVKMCKRILKEQTLPVGDVPFYKIGTFGSIPDAFITKELFETYKNKFSFPKKGVVLISASGTIGRTVRYQGEDAYFQDSNIVWLEHSNKLVTNDFLFYLYQLITWKPSVGAIQRLYNETILCTQIKFPSLQEQQKIAACLSSLDDLISAQSQKIEALKQHKKGLMQQLFPAMDEVA